MFKNYFKPIQSKHNIAKYIYNRLQGECKMDTSTTFSRPTFSDRFTDFA